MPVIMAGIRTAAVWVIGTATLSTPIGQTSLGNYIFAGLQTQNWVFVLFGCVAAAALALDRRSVAGADASAASNCAARARIAAGVAGLLLVVLAALLPGLGRAQARLRDRRQAVHRAIRAGRADRAAAGGARNCRRERRDGLGSSVIFDALAGGEIDVYVDYSGTLWANEMHRTDVQPRAEVLAEVARWLETTHGIRLLGSLGFENAYALAMTNARAEALGIRTIADLAAHAPQLIDRRRLRILRAAGVDGDPRRLWPTLPRRSAPCSPISCIRPQPPATST